MRTVVLKQPAMRWERPVSFLTSVALQTNVGFSLIEEKIGLLTREVRYVLTGSGKNLELFRVIVKPDGWGYQLPGIPSFMNKEKDIISSSK